MSQIILTIAQIDVRLGNPEHNFDQAEELVQKASEAGSHLVLLPELWASGFDLENWQRHAFPLGEGHFARMATMALEYNIAVGGSLLEVAGEKAFNTFVLYGPDGGITGVYRKIHLFRLMDEHTWLTPGDRPSTADLQLPSRDESEKVGMAVCYDLRFPELFRGYALQGCRIVLLPAEWGDARREHWRTLLRARAIENQTFMVGVNRCGESGGESFAGHSAVIGPWGETLAEAGDKAEILTIQIDLNASDEARQRIPILTDRKPEAYDLN